MKRHEERDSLCTTYTICCRYYHMYVLEYSWCHNSSFFLVLLPSSGQGRRFRETVLAKGGSRPAAEVYHDFRGRAPSTEALLRHTGLMKDE